MMPIDDDPVNSGRADGQALLHPLPLILSPLFGVERKEFHRTGAEAVVPGWHPPSGASLGERDLGGGVGVSAQADRPRAAPVVVVSQSRIKGDAEGVEKTGPYPLPDWIVHAADAAAIKIIAERKAELERLVVILAGDGAHHIDLVFASGAEVAKRGGANRFILGNHGSDIALRQKRKAREEEQPYGVSPR